MNENPFESSESETPDIPRLSRLRRIQKISGIAFVVLIPLAWLIMWITKLVFEDISSESLADSKNIKDTVRIGLGISMSIGLLIVLSGLTTVVTTIIIWMKPPRN